MKQRLSVNAMVVGSILTWTKDYFYIYILFGILLFIDI